MPTIIKRLEIDAGHRVLRHESKCANVHGHRYAFFIKVYAPELDSVGRVVDFSVIKDKVGGWLDENLDHGYIYHPKDTVGEMLKVTGQKVFQMPYKLGEPTAENLAALVGEISQELLGEELTVVSVQCQETPTSVAEWVKEDADKI